MSTLRSDSIKNRAGTGSPNFPLGATVTGVLTATSFVGSGANLTGIDATALKDSGGNVKVQANSSGAVVTGVLTATGNLKVGGVLTYEDVTNVDAVGIITARSGLNVTGGKVGIGTDDPADSNAGFDDLVIRTTGNSGQTIISGATNQGTVAFADGTAGAAAYAGYVQYNHSGNTMMFGLNGADKIRLGSSGEIGVAGGGSLNNGTAGQFLRSGGNSAGCTWASPSGKVLQVKFKESGSGRYNTTSGSWTKLDGSSGGLQESITPSATGNTILVQMYLSIQVGDGEYGGVVPTIHDGTNYISMMGEGSSGGSYHAPSAILGDNNRMNEHLRNAAGGNIWWPVMLQGRHLTTNTNSHTINLYARLGNGDFYFSDNQASNNMIILEIEGDIGN